jgi:tetratricopeptide (TPR) repeat protein
LRQYLDVNAGSADGHYLLGYVLFKQNDPRPSLDEYAQGARLRPPGAVELEVIGCDYFLLEDYPTADKWLTKSLEKDRGNALALYFLGRTRYNEKRFEDAARLFEECLRLDSRNVKAEESLGLAFEGLGRTEEAAKAYRAAVALDNQAATHDAGPYLSLGRILLAQNKPADALPLLMKAADLKPDDPRPHQELGKTYLALNELGNAQTRLERSIALDAASAPAHFLLAEVYRKQGLAAKAGEQARLYSLLTGSHSSASEPLAAARALVEANRLEEAEQAVRRYLETNKDSADGHFLLGYILFKGQKAAASLAEYTEGAKFRTPRAADLEVVGGDYVLLHDYPDADKWFTKSLEWNPNDFQTLYYLGRTKYNENRFEEAVAIFEQCLKQQPKSVKAEDNLGLSYQGLNRTEEAAAAFRTAISWQEGQLGRDSGPYLDLGSLLVATDHSQEALPYLQEALRISPRDLAAHRELGKTYLHLNELQKAQAELERSAELAPKDAPIHFMLAQLYRKRGLIDKARTETERYRELTGSHSTETAKQ